MRSQVKIALMCLIGIASAVLAVVPTMSASASVQQPQHATTAAASGTVAVPVHLTRGTHAVDQLVPMTAGAHPAGQVADGTHGASVRVGKNDCGGFNGQVSWGIGYIHLQGILWDDCGSDTTVYLYVRYDALGVWQNHNYYNVSGGSAGVNKGLLVRWHLIAVSPGSIFVDTCLQWNKGWGCGPAQPMQPFPA